MDLTMVYLFMTRTCFGFVGKNVGIGGSVGWIRTYVRTYVVYDDDVYVVRLIYFTMTGR